MPQQLYAYGVMILVVGIITLLYFWKSAPVRRAADRFGLTFLEARDYAMNGWRSVPDCEEEPDGQRRLLPLKDQPPAAREAMERGRDPRFAAYDKELESILEDMFAHLGSNRGLKRRYYDYFNNAFALHRNFLRVCTQPEPVLLCQAEWEDLVTYTGNRPEVIRVLAQRLSDRARRELLGRHSAGGSQPGMKEGIG